MESKRTVKPDGEKIARLRLDRGWSRAELAKESGRSAKTIDNVEAGRELYPFTLAKIAAGLSIEGKPPVKAGDLMLEQAVAVTSPPPNMASPQPGQHLPISRERMTVIIVKVSIAADEFDETTQLVSMVEDLKSKAGTKGAVAVLDVAYGSVLITLEMSEEDAALVSGAFRDGRLKDMLVEDVHPEGAARAEATEGRGPPLKLANDELKSIDGEAAGGDEASTVKGVTAKPIQPSTEAEGKKPKTEHKE